MSISSGYLNSANTGNIIPSLGSSFVLLPFTDSAGPAGVLSFLLGGVSGQMMEVTFEWKDTSEAGATITVSGAAGFVIAIENNKLNDPNQPSCSISVGQQL
jgi:hypothetical protein